MHVASLGGQTAARLADLGSILQDLTYVMGCCERLVPLLENDEKDGVLVEALWSGALVGYSRCFASGKRLGLDESILQDLPGEPLDLHQFMRDMRDKRVAHSVNPFEQVRVGAILSPPDADDPRVEGIATLSLRSIASSVDGAKGLWKLAQTLRARVAELGRETEEEVLAEARLLPVEELYARPDVRVVAPGSEVAGEARS